MDSTPAGSQQPDPLDHPIYRVAHLHGNEWVTLRPEEQHSPREDELGGEWAGGTIYHCEECGERVAIDVGELGAA